MLNFTLYQYEHFIKIRKINTSCTLHYLVIAYFFTVNYLENFIIKLFSKVILEFHFSKLFIFFLKKNLFIFHLTPFTLEMSRTEYK